MINWSIEVLDNKYKRWYEQLVLNAQTRILSDNVYSELHHIIPRSVKGNNAKTNLVKLTAREHFICHWLLVKMFTGSNRAKMVYALRNMRAENKYHKRYSTKITARVYEHFKIEFTKYHKENMTGRRHSAESLLKMSKAQKGRTFTNETKLKMAVAAKQKPPISNKTRQKLSEASKGRQRSPEAMAKFIAKRKGHIVSEETRQKIRDTLKARYADGSLVASEETRKKRSEAGKGRIISEEHKAILRKPRSTETKQKMAVAAKIREAKKKESGYTISDETREKLRQAQKNRWINPLDK